jgi:dTDP-4-amino-4,6-dideoxygalactose transaminase
MIYTSYPKHNFIKNKKKILDKISSIIDNGNYINSNEVINFEKNFSKFIGVKECASVGNATDAIFLALKSLDIKKSDNVITVSHTATATVTAIMRTGAKPILIDINELNYNIDINKVEKKINNKTKALIVVHLYGQSCDIIKLQNICKKFKIPLIEDCSQSAGSFYKNKRLGSFGLLSCFSFFPTKNLSTLGDGGCVLSKNSLLIKKIKSLREYGWDESRNSQYTGINSRLDEIHAGILNIKINYLDKDNHERRRIAKKYNKELNSKSIILPLEDKYCYHVYHHYVIRIKKRSKFLNYMKNNGFNLGIHYKLPVHNQKILQKYKYNLPITEKVSNEIVSLPMYNGLTEKNQNRLIRLINNFF